MKLSIIGTSAHLNNILIGFLGTLTVFILIELVETPLFLIVSIVLSALAVVLAKKTVHHFHVHHHGVADSAIDAVAPIVLLLANILHPAVDGFSFFQTLSNNGTAAAVVMGAGIVVHEILRQSALIVAFRPLRIQWYVVLITALLGIGGGIWLGAVESSIVQDYEYVADLATVSAYSFIIAELYFDVHRATSISKRMLWISIGVLIAGALHHVVSVH